MKNYIQNLHENLQLYVLSYCLPEDAREKYLLLHKTNYANVFYNKINKHILIRYFPKSREQIIDNKIIDNTKLRLLINDNKYIVMVRSFWARSKYYKYETLLHENNQEKKIYVIKID